MSLLLSLLSRTSVTSLTFATAYYSFGDKLAGKLADFGGADRLETRSISCEIAGSKAFHKT